LEKAKRLASEGFNTLLVCYNRQLADYLIKLSKDIIGLQVKTFHQLCKEHLDYIAQTKNQHYLDHIIHDNPAQNLYDSHYPFAFIACLESHPLQFEAIVCDEGQDFTEEFWLALEMCLADSENSPFYIFYDEYQNLYGRSNSIPIKTTPYTLTTNCRNSAPIHQAASHFYQGIAMTASSIEGEKVLFDIAQTYDEQAQKIISRITSLISRELIKPQDIVVLLAQRKDRESLHEKLSKLPLPKDAHWIIESNPIHKKIIS
jgi:superfamily I DNA and RNA helicase